MKSWGERLIGGLKRWRSQRSESSVDEQPDRQKGSDENRETTDRDTQEIIANNFRGENVDIVRQVTLETPDEEANADEPKALRPSVHSVLKKEETTKEPSSFASKARKMSPRVRPPETKAAQEGQQIVSLEEKRTSASAIPDKQRMITESISSLDHSSPDSELATETAQGTHEAVVAASTVAASENAIVALATDKQLLEKRSISDKANSKDDANQPTKSSSPLEVESKRHESRAKKSEDGSVTDAELAELEAENARLKLLILEKSKGEANSS